jgi:hypothetical protein
VSVMPIGIVQAEASLSREQHVMILGDNEL